MSGRCEHEDCGQDLDEVSPIKVDAGSGKEYCSTEHLLAAANRKRLDDGGNVIEEDKGPMPSESGNDITVVVPFFECRRCDNDSERIAREYGEWVHHICGEPVPDHTAQTANDLLENGEFDRGIVKHEARSLAQTMTPQLEMQEEHDIDAGADND